MAPLYQRTGLNTYAEFYLGGTTGGTTPDPGNGATLPQVPLLSPGTALGSYEGVVPNNSRYVDPRTGSNSNTGTLSSPFATFDYGLSAAINAGAAGLVLRGVAGGGESNCVLHKYGKVESQLSSGLATTVSKAGFTIMNAPGEAVMFDGGTTLAAGIWTQDATSGYWWRSYAPLNWSPQDTSNTRANNPTAYQAAIDNDDWASIDGKDPDGNASLDIYWQYLDSQSVFGAAANRPERTYRNGIQLAQVAKFANLQPGRFFIDPKAQRHWVADNPNGALMEFTVLQKLFNFLGNDQALLGVGIRRYANSMPLGGVIQMHRPRFRLEGNWFKDNSMAGAVYVGDKSGVGPYDSLIKRNSWENTKNVHWRMTQCDRLVVEDDDYVNGNDGRFNPAPAAGAWKVTRAQDTMVRYCRHINQIKPSYPEGEGAAKFGWFDVQIKRPTVHSCEFWNGGQKDVTYEGTESLSHFNNLSNNAGTEPVSYVDAGGTPYVMNNVMINAGANRTKPETRVILTFYSNGVIHGVRDSRRITPPQYFLDPRYSTTQASGVPPLEPMPMPDSIKPVSMLIANNITVGANARALYYDEDQVAAGSGGQSFADVGLQMDYNVWQLSANLSPSGTSGGQQVVNDTFNLDTPANGGQKSYATLAALRAVGLETHGQLLSPSAASPVDSTGNLTPAFEPQASNAVPLPARLAALIGVATGTTRLGRIPWVRS